MAPSLVLPSGMSTRSRTSVGGLSLRSSNFPSNPKRKQENSPPKGSKGLLKRRPALGELTNVSLRNKTFFVVGEIIILISRYIL